MRNYCVLTGENYLAKGLNLYLSLANFGNSFNFYYFCFDENTYKILNKLKIENPVYDKIILIDLKSLEDEELLRIKSTRTIQEYYFTLTPIILLFIFENYDIDNLTYLDADIYFYKDPEILFNEMGVNTILITEHDFSDEYKKLEYAGKYCVQFNPFIKDETSLKALQWWKEKCLSWCFHKAENGKWADQGYLAEWPQLFEKVHVMKNRGGGVAPWNVQNYTFSKSKNGIELIYTKNKRAYQLIFYHFQSLHLINSKYYYTGSYKLDNFIIKELYNPYVNNLIKISKEIKLYFPSANPLGITKEITFSRLKHYLINLLKGRIHKIS